MTKLDYNPTMFIQCMLHVDARAPYSTLLYWFNGACDGSSDSHLFMLSTLWARMDSWSLILIFKYYVSYICVFLFHHFQEVKVSVSFHCSRSNQDTDMHWNKTMLLQGKISLSDLSIKRMDFLYRLCAVTSCLQSDEQILRMVVQNLMSRSFSKSLSPPNRN